MIEPMAKRIVTMLRRYAGPQKSPAFLSPVEILRKDRPSFSLLMQLRCPLRMLVEDRVLERADNMKKGRSLLAKWETSRAINDVDLRCLLPSSDRIEKNHSRLARRRRIVARPHDLRRYLQTAVSASVPQTVTDAGHARGKRPCVVFFHVANRFAMGVPTACRNTGVQKWFVDVRVNKRQPLESPGLRLAAPQRLRR